MKIQFCDLCNESVPQGDLDLGRAALVKGRVVCHKCNELMHASAAAEATGGHAPGAVPLPGAAPQRPFGAETPGHAPYMLAQRQRGSGTGAGLAILGWIGIAAVGFWLFDRSEQESANVTQRFADLREQNRELGVRLEAARSELAQRAADDARVQLERLSAQGTQLNQALEQQSQQGREVEARISGFDQRLSSMQQSLGSLQRHDKELLALQQKYTGLASDLDDLGRVMGDLADEAARVARAPAAAEASSAPAWTGLVAGLSSADDGDRWQAVIALGETRDPAVAAHIVPVLKDSDIFVRMAAARILGDLGAPEGIPALIDALSDPEPSVREAVYSALKAVTKRDLPFDALSDNAEERSKRIKAWRDWWAREQPQVGG